MIHRVASADDPRLHPYRHVADPAWLRAHDLFVAEGRLVVGRLLDLPQYRLRSVLVTAAAYTSLQARLDAADAAVYVSDPGVLRSVTGFNFHRGCLALAARPAPLTPDALAVAPRLLGLEGVSNPDNVGGLFRAAAAFGIGGVLLEATAGDPLYRKAIRTSMGAALRVPFARAPDWLDALWTLRRAGHRLAALTPGAGALPLDAAAREVMSGKWILLAGAEGAGLSSETLALADVRLRIPIDPAVDSLNVVVATAVALYALRPDRP